MSRRRRAIVVVALALVWAAIALPNLATVVPPAGACLEILTAYRGLVTAVDCSAARAGIVAGDRILFDRLPLDQRYNNSRVAPAGTKVTYPVLHNGKVRAVTVVSDPETEPVWAVVLKTLLRASQLLFIVVAAIILLRRPSRVTWGFYLYALGNTMINVYFYSFLPAIPYYIVQFISYIFAFAGLLGLVMFALHFPNDRADRWRIRSERVMPYVFIAGSAYIGSVYTLDMLGILNGIPIMFLQFMPDLVLYAWAWWALAHSYIELREDERLRMRWAIAGVLFGTIAFLAVMAIFGFGGNFAANASLNIIAELAIPLAIGYAIVRHHLFDLRFVGNRTLVFVTLAAAAGLLFIILDWLSAHALPHSRASIAIALAVSLVFGFTASAGFTRLVSLVNRAVFPKRQSIMQRLDDMRVSVETSDNETDVQRMLTAGVCQVLDLSSAALFRKTPDGGFVREMTHGWSAGTTWHLLRDDTAVQSLALAPTSPLRLDFFNWHGVVVPTGTGRPSLAIPFVYRRHSVAVGFYGAHTNGSGIDPDELRALAALCSAASRLFGASTHRGVDGLVLARE